MSENHRARVGALSQAVEVAQPPLSSSWVGSRAETYFAAALITLTCLWAFLRLRDGELAADEGLHGLQIVTVAGGKLEIAKGLTMFPGYHVVMVLLAGLTGARSSTAIRTLSVVASVPVIPIFYLVVRQLTPRFAAVATLQFAFLPILFPFLFLLYTDGFSLVLVLLSVLLVLRGRRRAAAIVAILSVLVRQTNIICLAFVLGLAYVEDHGFELSRERVTSFLRRHPLFVAGLVAFGLFVVVNGGVAVGDRSAHPLKFSLGNVYLFLFLYFFLLLPVHLAALRPALMALRDLRVLGGALLLYAVFMLSFVNDHPYNQLSVEAFRYADDATFTGQAPFLRNLLLHHATRSALTKTLFFVPVLLSCLLLLKTKLLQPRFLLIYPLLLLLLTPSWLIEQRYSLVPLALLLLARERGSPALEYATAALAFSGAVFFTYGIDQYLFFL
jgi:alpha-1,2-glucosyltransferase